MPAPPILHAPLPYENRLQARDIAGVDLVVIHCTELPDLATAREYGERIHYPGSGTGNSGHFYLDRDGSVQQWVDPARIAHHVRGYNARAIGIELVNRGRWPHWHDATHQAMEEPYTAAQIAALIDLLVHLCDALPSLRQIAGHEDLDTDEVPALDDPAQRVRRKRDPGPLFPWGEVLEAVPLERIP
ncbi:N-acetylmuramoyl-L-alanine amidase [Marilutibacter chinensis]|uniref:N-acetylmuramoyl-L-alanine amidase n=1 Tax=Marilutibacter chinensis TaxID=2912247 RepID=A0ABS9HQ70_9GAMM|nr:N-acetylmuramoyl-L-alanine amidase [Lysobacter chinensis]MCF7221091.1 N-acetylmuramoyl-L-alanine amidase [Lysobacter chinensis]